VPQPTAEGSADPVRLASTGRTSGGMSDNSPQVRL
jgi:hypothetical protein